MAPRRCRTARRRRPSRARRCRAANRRCTRGMPAPGVGVVHHVVVDQRAAWRNSSAAAARHDLRRRRRTAGAAPAPVAEGRAQPLAAAQQVGDASATASQAGRPRLSRRGLPVEEVASCARPRRAPTVAGIQRVREVEVRTGRRAVWSTHRAAQPERARDAALTLRCRGGERWWMQSGRPDSGRRLLPDRGHRHARSSRSSAARRPSGRRSRSSSSRPRTTRAERRCGRRSGGWSRCTRRSCR